MSLVHVGGDEDEPQEPVELRIDFDVCVLDLRIQSGESQVNEDHPLRNAQDGGPGDFLRIVTIRRAAVRSEGFTTSVSSTNRNPRCEAE